MPANIVKTERDERLWSKAKAQAKEQGREEDWAYVTGIFKRMKSGEGGKKKDSDNKKESSIDLTRFMMNMRKQEAEKTAGKVPGVPDATGPYGRGMGPGGGRGDGTGLNMSQQEFIERYLKGLPEDKRRKFIETYLTKSSMYDPGKPKIESGKKEDEEEEDEEEEENTEDQKNKTAKLAAFIVKQSQSAEDSLEDIINRQQRMRSIFSRPPAKIIGRLGGRKRTSVKRSPAALNLARRISRRPMLVRKRGYY